MLEVGCGSAGVVSGLQAEEQNGQCGNTTANSQAPDDGHSNVRNMFSL